MLDADGSTAPPASPAPAHNKVRRDTLPSFRSVRDIFGSSLLEFWGRPRLSLTVSSVFSGVPSAVLFSLDAAQEHVASAPIPNRRGQAVNATFVDDVSFSLHAAGRCVNAPREPWPAFIPLI